ncbi:hypothetical protein GOP47_0009780 [Adiantum capillus-veneris]|uniref:Uncharacterized protein n=1 Tax=Adiantum capillus-veneris TaxID=13818 RepID=A0A9D4UXH3_ADICA|nr:hypothetical protein GOP47_0009780 [Adiantum capillus-veneris]
MGGNAGPLAALQPARPQGLEGDPWKVLRQGAMGACSAICHATLIFETLEEVALPVFPLGDRLGGQGSFRRARPPCNGLLVEMHYQVR